MVDIMGPIYGVLNAIFNPILAMDPNPANPALTVLIIAFIVSLITTVANKYLVDWNIERLSKVDKAILSIGIYELMYTETPSIVAINEAIELSKKYSDEKVTKMLNAALDKIYHNEGNDEQ